MWRTAAEVFRLEPKPLRFSRSNPLLSGNIVTHRFLKTDLCVWTGSSLTSSSEQQVNSRDGDGCGGVSKHSVVERAGPYPLTQCPLGLAHDPHHCLPLPRLSSFWSHCCCNLWLRGQWLSLRFGFQQVPHRRQFPFDPSKTEVQLFQLWRDWLQQGFCLLAAQMKLF